MEFLHLKVHRDFLPYAHHLHWPHLDLEHIPYLFLKFEPTLDYDPILEHHPSLHHPFTNDTSDTDSDITMVDSPPRTPSPTSELDEPPSHPLPRTRLLDLQLEKTYLPHGLAYLKSPLFQRNRPHYLSQRH